jgi:hypothetical protein
MDPAFAGSIKGVGGWVMKIKIDDRNDVLGVAEVRESAFHESR